jgi:RsiW-degrading membrane proteinase PrsW (M82 family)
MVGGVTDQEPAAPPAPPAPAEPAEPARPGRSRWPRWLSLALVIGFIAVCAIAVLGVLGWSIGVDAVIVGTVAAIIPVPVLVLVFLWLGRYEPEPVRYLVFCFTWGAFVAAGAALAVNASAAWAFEQAGLPVELVAVLVAPVIEEAGKAAAPLLLLLRSRHAITGITKGIVYCGMSAIGFAMVENILYIGGHGYRAGMDEFGVATGVQLALVIFIVRILMSAFAHPLFTAAAGVGIGLAARTPSVAARWALVVAGLVAAMVLHATWNLMAIVTGVTGEPLIFLYGYVALMVPLFLGAVGLAIVLRAREGQLTQRTLPDYVRSGWFSPPEVASLRSLGTRHSARRWARRVAGEPGGRSMRRFQLAATRLAVLRDGVIRGLPAKPADRDRTAAEERALLAEIAAHREGFAGHDPQVPPARWDGRSYEIVFPDGSLRPVAAPDEPVVPVPVVLTAPAPGPWPADHR